MPQAQATQSQTVERAREYETIYVLRPDADVETAKKVSDRVQDVVGKAKGKLTLVESWGRRKLAYPVQKNTRGVYIYLKYLGGGELVRELERHLRMLDPVLKFQTVRLERVVDSAASVEVDPEDVKFEPVAPMDESDVDDPLERVLGLEPSYTPRPSSDEREGSADAAAEGGDSAESATAGASAAAGASAPAGDSAAPAAEPKPETDDKEKSE